jgi:HEAT repeat protein
VAEFPSAGREGSPNEADKKLAEETIAELQRGGREAVTAVVALLTSPEQGGDSKARHALHALVTHVAAQKDPDARQALAEALNRTLGQGPVDVQVFVVRQLQRIGDRKIAPALGKLLADDDLWQPAAQALVAIREGAAEQLRGALPAAKGKCLVAIVQSLGALRDTASAASLRKLVTDPDREVRLAAVWALANMGDTGSPDLLLKAAEAEGYERVKATDACLLLAERLEAGGKGKDARVIYRRLYDTRTDPSEKHIREAARRKLESQSAGQ